jgi:hypothetical protein
LLTEVPTAPVLTTPGTLTLEQNTPAGAIVNFSVTATDLVSVPVIECSPPSGSEFPIGISTVLCKAVDAAGNQDTELLTIRVTAPASDSGKVVANGTVTLTGQTGKLTLSATKSGSKALKARYRS